MLQIRQSNVFERPLGGMKLAPEFDAYAQRLPTEQSTPERPKYFSPPLAFSLSVPALTDATKWADARCALAEFDTLSDAEKYAENHGARARTVTADREGDNDGKIQRPERPGRGLRALP